jgi:hypothetical protein
MAITWWRTFLRKTIIQVIGPFPTGLLVYVFLERFLNVYFMA